MFYSAKAEFNSTFFSDSRDNNNFIKFFFYKVAGRRSHALSGKQHTYL